MPRFNSDAEVQAWLALPTHKRVETLLDELISEYRRINKFVDALYLTGNQRAGENLGRPTGDLRLTIRDLQSTLIGASILKVTKPIEQPDPS